MTAAHRLAQVAAAAGLFTICSACFCQPNKPDAGAPQPTQAVTPSPTSSAPAVEPAKRAVAGKESATIARVSCSIESVRLAKPRYRRFSGTEWEGSEEKVILVATFSTTSDTLKRSVSDVGGPFTRATATDDFGNDYHLSDPDDAVGNEHESLTADRPVKKVIIIEKPIPKATRLDLDIPAVGVGEKGAFRFTVPVPPPVKSR